MRNSLILAAANLRKGKSQTVSVSLLIIISAMLLNIGLVLFFDMGSVFSERAEELNTPHFVAVQPSNGTESEPIQAHLDYIQKFRGTTGIETESILYDFGSYSFGESENAGFIILTPNTGGQQMNPLTLTGDSLPLTDNAVYIPHFMFMGIGYGIGDSIIIAFGDTELVLTIAGSTEDMMFGAAMNTVWRFYITEQTYSELEARFPDSRHTLISARMTDGWPAFSAAYRAEFGGLILTYDTFLSARTFIPTIASLMIVVFAVILLVVGVIVIRFRINNDIEEGMVNIGALKALGYTSGQIIMSIAAQFGLIAFGSSLIGILPAQIILPVITGSLLSPMLGMPWNPAFNPLMSIIAITSILLMILLFAYVTSKRISKLHPIIALRGGLATHSFKKNHLPLENTRGSLNFLLAFKQLLQNKKRAVMLCVIVAGLTFSSVAVLIAHYNINVNTDAFVNTIIGYSTDVSVKVNNADDGAAFKQRMTGRTDVYSVFGRESMSIWVDENPVDMLVVEDFNEYAGYSLARGRIPMLNSEIVLSNTVLMLLGKDIGDWVTVRYGEHEQQYIITGVAQVMAGFRGMINVDGLTRIQPDFAFTEFGIYLTAGTDIRVFIETVGNAESDVLARIRSVQESIDSVLGSVSSIFSALGYAIMAVVASVVILVLNLIIKTIIVRRKRELGIQKALGFTTMQLMNQISLNLTPSIILGVLIGATGGYISFNPIFTAAMRGMGIVQANLPAPTDWILIVSVGIIALAYAVSMLIAWRIRKISAYSLVTE